MEERILAEAELLAGATYRVIREKAGDYATEYREGERFTRHWYRGLDAAMDDFVETVCEIEVWSLGGDIANSK